MVEPSGWPPADSMARIDEQEVRLAHTRRVQPDVVLISPCGLKVLRGVLEYGPESVVTLRSELLGHLPERLDRRVRSLEPHAFVAL